MPTSKEILLSQLEDKNSKIENASFELMSLTDDDAARLAKVIEKMAH